MVPALPALLADAPRQVHGDAGPVARPVAPDNRGECLVFGLRPGRVRHVAPVAQLEVALVALDLRLAQQLADAAPGRLAQLPHQRQQLRILYKRQISYNKQQEIVNECTYQLFIKACDIFADVLFALLLSNP